MRTASPPLDTGVYAIRNVINGKRYVGHAAMSFRKRWREHRSLLNAGKHFNRHLQFAWNKYGEDAFVFEILARCKPPACVANEQRFIDKFRTTDMRFGYNICPVAGSRFGLKMSEESRARVAAAARARSAARTVPLPTCNVEGCGNRAINHRPPLCNAHYLRWHRHGDPLAQKLFHGDLEAAFWQKVNKDGPEHPSLGKCWDWTGFVPKGKRPRIKTGYRLRAVIPLAWELHFGEVPDGMVVLQKCGRSCCVNPAHLQLGTHEDVIARTTERGRWNKGEDRHNAKFTEEIIRQIRSRHCPGCKTNGSRALAKEFGVAIQTIRGIVHGRSWKHVS